MGLRKIRHIVAKETLDFLIEGMAGQVEKKQTMLEKLDECSKILGQIDEALTEININGEKNDK
jgi:DNA-binding FrmR family transcriptional regulator